MFSFIQQLRNNRNFVLSNAYLPIKLEFTVALDDESNLNLDPYIDDFRDVREIGSE